MCPACLAAAAMIAAGAGSTGGLAAVVILKLRARKGAGASPRNPDRSVSP